MTNTQPFERGTPLYTCDSSTGEVQRVYFLEESIAEGASMPSWVVRDSERRRIRCSRNSYLPSVREARHRWLEAARQSVLIAERELQKHIEDRQNAIVALKGCIDNVAKNLAETPA
jgi:hypothetical protein